jgi:hypothetical protein
MEGPDGSSPLPIKPFLDSVAALKVSPNFGLFVGQGTVRDQVMGSSFVCGARKRRARLEQPKRLTLVLR